MPRLTVKCLKCTLVLNPDELAVFGDPVTPRITLHIEVPDLGTVAADIAAKSLRKAQATIADAGSDGVAVIVQGKLMSGNRIIEAGLVAQLRAPKPVEVAA